MGIFESKTFNFDQSKKFNFNGNEYFFKEIDFFSYN